MPGLPLLEAAGLGVRFPGARRDALRDISLSIAPGECIAVLGPSGSGKSTLALALLGAIPHLIAAERRGTVHWPRRDPQPKVAAGSGLAALSQQDADAQLVALTVEDELAFALENRGLPAQEIESRIARWLAVPPMSGLLREQATLALSAGWRQRLALGAALAEQSSLLVLDEPTAHLDEGAARDALGAIEAARSFGTALILIEHRADLVCSIADRVLALDAAGAPLALGRPADVLAGLCGDPGAAGIKLPPAVPVAQALRGIGLPLAGPPILDAGQLFLALGAQASDPAVQSVVHDVLRPHRREQKTEAIGAPLVVVRRASLRRGEREALSGVDLSVHAGEIVGLAGPNGAGKTSLGLLAAGALRPTDGTVSASAARAPAFVPQNPALVFASASLELEARRRNLPWSAVAIALSRFGLDADPGRHPLRHSHGELRRVALAMAFASAAPHLIVLDEPTSGLDALGLDALRRAMVDLAVRRFAILAISHDLDFVGDVADRLVVLDRGRIVAEGAADAVLDRAAEGALPLCLPPRADLARRFRVQARR